MLVFPTFAAAISNLERKFLQSNKEIRPLYWQATRVGERPEATMREICFVDFGARVAHWSSDELALAIEPNLPWAEDHFQERVSGKPVNPGWTWTQWPWSNSADTHRDEKGHFNHNYMERYWPKFANDAKVIHQGIRHPYGDLKDVVAQIARDPLTRQAYMPVFFPEDTGAVHGGRVPCSIGYHFMIRDDELHCTYQLRSCDLWRHFRDDMYLTARLMQWVVEELSLYHDVNVQCGTLYVHIASLHMFVNDYASFTKKLSA